MKMKTLAMNDQLTGLMNRRSFLDLAQAHVAQERDQDQPGALIMADIDHFKQVNDQHGHQIGDEVLQSVARTISESFRSTDLVCRWGGEEFLIYLPGANLDIARRLAEDLRKKIEGSSHAKGLKVSISAGVAVFEDNQTLAEVTQRADQRLYDAKQAGRNRVKS